MNDNLSTLAAVDAALNADRPGGRVADYLARLDAHLAGLRNETARGECLISMKKRWLHEHYSLQRRAHAGEILDRDTFGAWDVSAVLSGIDERIARYALVPA